ncbi:hypothetical protein H4S02_003331 [Coemansia sp. RSA 2611]|nr:hypothetical protein H4S02_003331 [Coemansia sp. RSA 2611]
MEPRAEHERELNAEQRRSMPDSLGLHASKSAGSRRSSGAALLHRRKSSSGSIGSIKRKLGGLFRRSSRSSLQPASPERGRRLSTSGRSHHASSPEADHGARCDDDEWRLAGGAVARETQERMDSSTFLLSDDDDDLDTPADQCLASLEPTGGTPSAADDRPSMRSPSTFSAQYKAVPAPGMWSDAPNKPKNAQPSERPNMPLEPEEYAESRMPWIIDQMGMGEQAFSSLFHNDVGYANVYGDSDVDSTLSAGRHVDRKRRRKQAFGVLKARVGEARVGVQKDVPAPDVANFRRPDGTADYLDFACSWIKHYADTQLSHKLDFRHSSADPCKLDRFLITLQRLVEVSAPYQRFVIWLYKLARWDNPRLTLWWCFVYFMLLYHGMMAMFLWMTPAFIVAYHRLRPSQAYHWLGFERPETSLIPSKIVQEASSGTIAKGLIANRMWDIWRETLGAHLHVVLADLADWMERAKNCATWKRPWASRAVTVVLLCMGLFVYLIPAAVFQKLFGICVGVQFFFLAPLQLRHQRYRRMLWIIDIILWNCPNDTELSLETLYMESRGYTYAGPNTHAPSESSQPSLLVRIKAYLQVLVADMIYAYNPLATERRPPVMVLQTASSTALDQMGDDMAETNTLYDAFVAGKQLGKNMLRDTGDGSGDDDDDKYTGLGADGSMPFPSVMGVHEEREWIKQSGLAPRTSRAFSTDTLGVLGGEDILCQPAKDRDTRLWSQMTAPQHSSANAVSKGNSDSSGDTSPKNRGSLLAKAKGLSSRVLRRKSLQEGPDQRKHELMSSSARNSAMISTTDFADESERMRRMRFSLDLKDINLARYSVQELGGSATKTQDSGNGGEITLPDTPDIKEAPRGSIDSLLLRSPVASTVDSSTGSGSLELTHEANRLQSLRNKDARATKDGIDLSSLYAFRCIHQGKYGTLFVTSDRFVFRRSRIMGGRRSSVSSYLLSNVVAIRKSASGLGKSHGIQLLLSNGKSYSFFGLSNRDDVFGFLLLRCGNRHLY